MNRPRHVLQVLDRQQDIDVIERRLPHWSQAGTVTFITFRTWDSIPREVQQRFFGDRQRWLRAHRINPDADDWRDRLRRLPRAAVREFRRSFSQRWHAHLDDCHGECVLRQRSLAAIIANSLVHFDGERYTLTDFVVMPNHVHILVAFPTAGAMLAQCESWKRFTAIRINRCIGRRGRFWQQDGFDHLVRSIEQFTYLRRYIATNSQRASLPLGVCAHFSKRLNAE